MVENLHQRALEKRDALAVIADRVSDALLAVRTELTRRHPAPSSLADQHGEWLALFGASQHVEVANAQLAKDIERERDVRAEIAAIEPPADPQTLEAELRTNLVRQAELRVELRGARERMTSLDTRLERISTLHELAQTELRSSNERVSWAKEQQDRNDGLIDALSAEPLASVPVRAKALVDDLTGPLEAANQRLTALVHLDLRARAHERFEESRVMLAEAELHARNGQERVDRVAAEFSPLEAPVRSREHDYLSRQTDLALYVNSADVIVAAATPLLEAIAAYPDLTTGQADAILNPQPAPATAEAMPLEVGLAALLPAERTALRGLHDAILDALLQAPDIDPPASGEINTAIQALEDARTPELEAARDNLNAPSRELVSKWEIEVPQSLWAALGNYIRVERDLQELAPTTTTESLVEALGAAQDDLIAALNDRDDWQRSRLMVELATAEREGHLAAARRTSQDRNIQYLRGDGTSGRTAAEL